METVFFDTIYGVCEFFYLLNLLPPYSLRWQGDKTTKKMQKEMEDLIRVRVTSSKKADTLDLMGDQLQFQVCWTRGGDMLISGGREKHQKEDQLAALKLWLKNTNQRRSENR